MDDPQLDPAAHEQALRALNRVNRWLTVDHAILTAARTFGSLDELSTLDLGAGGGGLLRCFQKLGRSQPRRLIALDRSPFALIHAQKTLNGSMQSIVADVRRLPLVDAGVDLVICSLLLHHFAYDDIVTILGETTRIARRGVIISDLVRSRSALASTWLFTRAVSRSHVFHIDGSRSVRAALRREELSDLAHQAGMSGARITRQFPFRMMLTWRKQ